MGGSASSDEQVIPDTGEPLELLQVLTDSLTARTMRSLAKSQETTIKQLDAWVRELTAQINTISRKI